MSMEGHVCNKCLERYPTRIDLITDICYSKREHASESKVKVTWTAKKKLKRVPWDKALPIRWPVPKVHFYGKFKLCNGKHCRGEKCTFPHNVAERDAWNEQKCPRTPARK